MARTVIGGGDVTKAAAKLISYDDEGHRHAEEVDFVQHRLTKKMSIAMTDEDGNPVRISSAIEAIRRAAKSLHDELYQR